MQTVNGAVSNGSLQMHRLVCTCQVRSGSDWIVFRDYAGRCWLGITCSRLLLELVQNQAASHDSREYGAPHLKTFTLMGLVLASPVDSIWFYC